MVHREPPRQRKLIPPAVLVEVLMFELHIWGPLEEIVSFSPDCVAAIWYMYLTVDAAEIKVVPSSNVNIASNGLLPALRHNHHVHGGFTSIVTYLKSLGYDLDGDAPQIRLISSFLTNVALLSLHFMYVNRTNFDKVMRPLFTQLVPFPMQYNLPIYQKDLAKRQCASSGIVECQPQNNDDDDLKKKYPSLSKLQEQIDVQGKERKALLDDAKQNLKVLAKTQQIYDTLLLVLPGIRQGNFAFGQQLTTVDLILLANLQIQTCNKFPSSALKSLLDLQYPDLHEYLQRGLGQLSTLPVELSTTDTKDLYSLTNVLFKWARW
jgi:sorting and assembly machinery component 37